MDIDRFLPLLDAMCDHGILTRSIEASLSLEGLSRSTQELGKQIDACVKLNFLIHLYLAFFMFHMLFL